MSAQDRVVIKNIYYMMSYAFRSLDIKEYARLGAEEFDNFADLMAAILAIGMGLQRKRGFEREYLETQEDLHTVRGRIDMRRTAQLKMGSADTLSCHFDEFSEDTYKNRILKTTARLLIGHDEVSAVRKRDLKRVLILMRDVGTLDPARIDWGRPRYHRNNGAYQMLMNVCYMVINSELVNQDGSSVKAASFVDDQKLHALYERFVLEYFKREHPTLKASARDIDRKTSDDAPAFLPHLITDITLERGNTMLIIDTKCYGQILNTHHDHEILSPANVNQITSYVVHAAYQSDMDVQGMLLYALTDREAAINSSWYEIGHRFHVRTLDLGQDFSDISAQLDAIAGLVG